MSEDLEQRVNTNDAKVAAIETSVESLIGSFNSWRSESRQEYRELRSDIQSLADAQSSAQKTPIAPLIAFASLVFTVMAALFIVMSTTDNRIEAGLIKLTDSVISHQGDGHPKVQQEAIISLKEGLRRVEQAGVTNEKLDSELKAIHAEIAQSKMRLTRTEQWTDRHDQKVPVINSRQDTKDIEHDRRLDALESKK